MKLANMGMQTMTKLDKIMPKIKLGTHIALEDSMYISLLNTLEHFQGQGDLPPLQIFLSNPRSRGIREYSDEDIEQSKTFILQNNLQLFVHAPYFINPANPKDYYFKNMKQQFTLAKQFGCKGVVIHIGSSTEEKKVYMKHLKLSLMKMARHSTEACPLLLETNAGEGNDVCWKIEEFFKLYSFFFDREKYKNNVKVCVDTCHVFSSGYNPSEFIEKFIDKFGSESLALIHFNDSKFGKGCHCDRHAKFFTGYIGIVEMGRCILLADKYGIPLVRE